MKLYGKDALVSYFDSARRKSLVRHLYIFEGAVGMGKKTLCRYLAAMLHCESENAPCGTCSTCIKTESGNHPDIIFVEADEKNPLNAERARALVADMYVKPFLAQRKIYIIPNGEQLSPAAQNTLLKAFEEPPPYVTIFLTTTNRDALLKTVLSRGIILSMHGCPASELESYICETYPKRIADAHFLALSAGGSIGTAKRLAEDEEYLAMRDALFALMPRLTGPKSGIYSIVKFFEEHKASLPVLLSFFSSWMRDTMYVHLESEPSLINSDFKSGIADFAFSVSPKSALCCHEAALALAAKIGKGSNFTLWITDFLSEAWRYCHGTDCRH
ncbi:MAG: hypothetical protein IJN74_01595 [Clostridia bacterium]|nr:hypothetical protein [Clostridia bacterium]